MEHFSLYNKPQKILKEFVLPFFWQFVLVVVAIVPHRLFINRGNYILPQTTYLGELTSPTSGRLVFAVSAMILCFVFAFISSKLAKKEKLFLSFTVGILSGTFLWQSLGEDLWHFGIYENGELVNFLKLESIQVLPIVLPFLLFVLYGMFRKSFDFGILCAVSSFLCNWMGHYCSHATYPIVASFMEISKWYIISGIAFGGVLLLLGIYLGVFASRDKKGRYFSSIVAYIGVAIFVFGMIG